MLLLDEPTNDLDVETLNALEDLLDEWAGTLVVVSHDRYFLERVCDGVVGLLGDGRLRDLPGGVDEYLRLREAAERAAEATLGESGRGVEAPSTPEQERAARKALVRIERQLGKLADAEARLHAQMEQAATDHVRVGELDVELRSLQRQVAELEEEWLLLSDD